MLTRDFAVSFAGDNAMVALRRHGIIIVLTGARERQAFVQKFSGRTPEFNERGRTALYWNGVTVSLSKPEFEGLQGLVAEGLL